MSEKNVGGGFTVNIDRLPKSGKSIRFEADEQLRSLVASETGVSEVLQLSADVLISPAPNAGAKVTGNLQARVEQECVTTLKSLISELQIVLNRQFIKEKSYDETSSDLIDGEWVIDPGDDIIDYLEQPNLNLLDLIVEELNLHIDPFPRSKEAVTIDVAYESSDLETKKPFSGLKDLLRENSSKSTSQKDR